MTSFRQRPSRRKDRAFRASAIVLGEPASAILHHGRTAHILPVRSSDHRSRYATGQRLAVKVMVPGPTACHVILTSVHGPRQKYTLGQITITEARALGHTRLDAFWRHWITNHDQAWLGRHIEAGTDTDEEIQRRFHTRWDGKLAWLLRFHLDAVAAPRLLADETGAPSSYTLDTQGRWVYAPRHNERDSDRGYTTSDSRALRGELPALTDEEWKQHIGPQSRYREQDRLAQQRADREARNHPERLAHARTAARSKGYDITQEIRLHDAHVRNGKTEKALRQLELIEARVFPTAA